MRLVCLAKIVDHQVRLEADLRDPSGEGGCVRFAHHLHPRESARVSGRRFWDHPAELSCRLLQWRTSLQPGPCNIWHQPRGWGRLSHVLRQFLCAGLVQRFVRSKWSEDIITHYFVLLHVYRLNSLSRKCCCFLLCKGHYIRRPFFPIDQWNRFTGAKF